MFTPILVAYASQYGSTRDVALTIAATLRQEGHGVDVEEMRAVSSLEGYRAVMVGAPFYAGRWHADVRPFLDRFREELRDHPVAVFALGPVGAGEVPALGNTRQALLEELAGYPWLHPIAAEMFGGRYDPDRLRAADAVLAAQATSPLHGMPANDRRDWDAIRAWAQGVGSILLPAPT
jgi:menaquinone-dependent protoporphyrinogen oxidase